MLKVPASAFPMPFNKDHIHKVTYIIKENRLRVRRMTKEQETDDDRKKVSVFRSRNSESAVSVFMIVTV